MPTVRKIEDPIVAKAARDWKAFCAEHPDIGYSAMGGGVLDDHTTFPRHVRNVIREDFFKNGCCRAPPPRSMTAPLLRWRRS
jgi:hypothetical protein